MENRWERQRLKKIVKESKSKCEVLKKLDLKLFTGNYETLNRYLKKYNIDESNLKRSSKIKKIYFKDEIPLHEIMISGSTYSNRSAFKKKLYKEGIKQPICEMCGQDENWIGKKITLILDHINGDNSDNRLENLRILCPNCNATLPTHCGKNVKDKKIRKSKEKYTDYCKCGSIKNKYSKQCLSCHNEKNRKIIQRPPYKTLLKEVEESGYSATGRKYGVSDNAIRKWVRFYEKNI